MSRQGGQYGINLARRRVQYFPQQWLVRGTMPAIDRYELTVQRFGRLVVLALLPKRKKNGAKIWLCKCDCGALTRKEGASLRAGHTRSCGCLRKEIEKNLGKQLGAKYGRQGEPRPENALLIKRGARVGDLTVLEQEEQRWRGNIMWRCRCECGREVLVTACEIHTGRQRSCGCRCTNYKGETSEQA